MSQPDFSGFVILGLGFSIILIIAGLIIIGLIKLLIKWGKVLAAVLEALLLAIISLATMMIIFYGIGRLVYLIIR